MALRVVVCAMCFRVSLARDRGFCPRFLGWVHWGLDLLWCFRERGIQRAFPRLLSLRLGACRDLFRLDLLLVFRDLAVSGLEELTQFVALLGVGLLFRLRLFFELVAFTVDLLLQLFEGPFPLPNLLDGLPG